MSTINIVKGAEHPDLIRGETLMSAISIVKGAVRLDLLREETLACLFKESAYKFANKTALIFENQLLTYAELDSWSDAVAMQLAEQGIKRGDKIGIWWRRGIELHVAILGIIKAGAAYVPIDR